MKNIIIKTIIYVIICLLGMLAFVSCNCSPQSGEAELVYNFQSIDELIQNSPTIVIGTVDGPNEEFVYGEVTFALTKFKVEQVVRGTVPAEINILQTKMNEDPFLKNGDKMVLFLTKYEGPVTKNAYVIMGLYQGQYTIEGTTVIKNENNKLTGSEFLQSLDILISRINTVGYHPKTY
jgi:hypothetical protein